MVPPLTALVQTYAEELRSFAELAGSLVEDDWARPTECPGWTVHDQVAHVVSLELELSGHPLAAPLASYGAHVRNPVGERMENGVDALRGQPPVELLVRLAAAITEHLAQLQVDGLDGDRLVVGPRGTELPLHQLLVLRVFDVWAHEQDVRRAVGRPGGLDTAAAGVSVGRVTATLPYLVGKELAAPPGTSVAVEAAGDVPVALTVTVGADGRAVPADGVAPNASVTLRTDTATLLRLACGRIDPATAAVTLSGDEDLGRRLLDVLAITP